MTKKQKPPGTLIRILLIVTGVCSVGLAVAGIFLPLLPTVPLLLLAAACFARSSERCYGWLIGHARLGPMIRGYLHGRGIPRRAKVSAITMLWFSLSLSIFLVRGSCWLQFGLVVIGISVTCYLVRLPALEPVRQE